MEGEIKNLFEGLYPVKEKMSGKPVLLLQQDRVNRPLRLHQWKN